MNDEIRMKEYREGMLHLPPSFVNGESIKYIRNSDNIPCLKFEIQRIFLRERKIYKYMIEYIYRVIQKELELLQI